MAVAGFCHYLRRLAAKFPPPIIPDEGPSLEQLLREKENSLKEAAGKNEDLDKEVAGLRAKVNRLEKDVDNLKGPICPRPRKLHSTEQNSESSTRGRNSGSSLTS